MQVVSARELEALGVSAVLDLRQPAVLCKTERGNMRDSFRWVSVRDGCLAALCLPWHCGAVWRKDR